MPVANQGPRMQAVSILFLVLAWISVSLRCYVRAVLIKSFGSDDWLILASLATFTIFLAFGFLCIRGGGGKHIHDISLSNLSDSLKWWWLAEIFYATSTGLLKFSIGAFLLRITVTRIHLYTIWIAMILVGMVTTLSVVLVIIQCNPVNYFWLRYSRIEEGSCIDTQIIMDVAWAHSVINCCADWVLAVLPVFMVWTLDMNPRTKMSVALILALGALGSSATIVRCLYVKGLAQIDFLWSTAPISIWSIVEVGIGTTAASLATLKPLFVKFFSRSHLFGDSETLPSTFGGFTTAQSQRSVSQRSASRSNYVRSHYTKGSTSTTRPNTANMIELNLREDLGKGHGVTTVINSDWKSPIEEETGFMYTEGGPQIHRSVRRYRSDRVLNSSKKSLFGVGRSRSLSQTRLSVSDAPVSPNWESGIRKTMVITTNAEGGEETPPGNSTIESNLKVTEERKLRQLRHLI